MEKRIGTISVFINEKHNVDRVNSILTEYSELIISRMGVPYRERHVAVIVIIVDGTNDTIGALAGKLGNILGVSVKTALAKM